MRVSTTLVSLGLLLGTGLAIAAPSIPKPGPCVPATAEMCKKAGYIDTKCGQENRAICEPILKDALEEQHERSKLPEFPGLRPKLTNIPTDLRPTKYHAYPGPTLGKKGTSATKRGTNALARTRVAQLPVARDKSVDVATAAAAHRNPAWDANGQVIESCAELAYESYYDGARFVDAGAACRGDTECVMDVAYLKATPGVAARPLKRRDGKTMSPQIDLVGGKRPKNEMFAYAAQFARSGKGGWLEPTPEIAAMAAALNAGRTWYAFGCNAKKDPACNKARSFGTEWDFHRVMRSRNAAVSHAEHAEYERRMAELRELIALHAAAVAKEEQIGIDKLPPKRLEPAFDEMISDPFDRVDKMTGFAAKMIALQPKLLKSMSAIERTNLKKAGVEGVPGLQGRHTATPTATLALPASRGAWPTLAPSIPKPPQHFASPCAAKNFPDVRETFGVGPISCRIGELLREEWRRKTAGHKSCLDLDHDDCDWSPQLFTARFVTDPSFVAEMDRTEKECIAYTGDVFPTPFKDLTAAESHIESMRTAIADAREKLRPYKTIVDTGSDKRLKYAKRYGDKEVMGDTRWFAGGYSYDVGWSLEVLPAPVQNGAAPQPCEVVGRGDAKGTIDGWVGGKHIAVADGGIDGVINEDGKDKGRVIAWLDVLGVAVVERKEHEFSSVFEDSPVRLSQQLPPQKPSFVVMAGPIPITGSLWGALSYGVNLRFEARSISKTCVVTDLEFGIETTFKPWIRADGFAQAGIGISGFASVGIRGMLNLITIDLPVVVDVALLFQHIPNKPPAMLEFDVTMSLLLGTLSGSLSLYFELMGFDEELELFRWNGIGPTGFPLINPPLHADLPFAGLGLDMPKKDAP